MTGTDRITCECHRWVGTPGKDGTCPVHGYVKAPMTDADRLTAALRQALRDRYTRVDDDTYVALDVYAEDIGRAIIAADPALICPDPNDHLLRDASSIKVNVVQCPDPADHALADAVRDLFSNGYSVLRGCPCGDESHAEVRHLNADKAFAVVGMADPPSGDETYGPCLDEDAALEDKP